MWLREGEGGRQDQRCRGDSTTTDRSGLQTPTETVDAFGAGGLSGAPLKTRSLEVLRRLRRVAGDSLLLISVGGIENADDAWARIRAGATLVQLYTAFIYGGPLLPKRICQGLAQAVTDAGYDNIAEAIGVDA